MEIAMEIIATPYGEIALDETIDIRGLPSGLRAGAWTGAVTAPDTQRNGDPKRFRRSPGSQLACRRHATVHG
jgi:hypothetical protein